MKKTIFLCLLNLACLPCFGQLTSLSENFNSLCTTPGIIYPTHWTENHSCTTPNLPWTCSPTSGRNATGGMDCTGYYNSSNYADTALLISPSLDLSGYPGSIYLRFDAKTEHLIFASQLQIWKSNDSFFMDTTTKNISGSNMTPSIGANDTLGWVTHQVNLTAFKNAPVYVGFKYLSAVADVPTIWHIDNVMTTEIPFDVAQLKPKQLPLTVIGNSSPGQIKLLYTIMEAGPYQLSIYDIMGRRVYQQELQLKSGTSAHTISELQLQSGMYFIKMGNGMVYGTAKAIVE